ncbi:carbonic anhydrase [Thalassoglobus sp.]|uniref:carbonic anhydrase n=1 Tax=Thalassoglobus sp. TaxID=2795869 RepID=UPI003AA7C2D5
MQKLMTGIHQFQDNIFSDQEELFTRLSRGQQPLALFITCSDSRICPNLLTQTEPGELFILRTAGNVVPPYGAVRGGEAATIEYAVSVLKVRDIVVCGHSHCGVMQALLNPEGKGKLPAVDELLMHVESTKRILEENYASVEDPQKRLTLAIEENVLVQLENLRTHPSVIAALSRKELNVHGWVYKFETGKVFGFSHRTGQFVTVDQAEGRSPQEHRQPVAS